MKETEVRRLCKRILAVLGYTTWSPKPTYIPKVGYRAQDIFALFDIEAVKPGNKNMQVQITTGHDGGAHRRRKIMEKGFQHDLEHNEITVWALIHKDVKERYFLVHKINPKAHYTVPDYWERLTKITVTRIGRLKFYKQNYNDGKLDERKFEYDEEDN